IFFAAVLFSSPIAALYGILCSMITLPTLFYFSYNETDIYNGMLSFNVVLCAITFAGKKMVDFLWAMLSSVIAICCSYILLKLNVAMLTFPFVVASCFTYYLKLFLDKKKTNKPTKG
ncbi:MAG TPA: urea transporter, partial [Bacteroidia bacterium]|nr:urea transporter [Bacteroidia bacterium]